MASLLEPRPYQRAIVDGRATARALALFLEQGLGKTKVVLDMANFLWEHGEIRGLVVISKKSVVSNWFYEELDKNLGPSDHDKQLYLTERKNKILPVAAIRGREPLQVLLMNEGCVRTDHGLKYLEQFIAAFDTLLVVDESTIIKGPTSQITKALTKVGRYAAYRRILCGEPAPQGPVDYFSQYRFLDPEILGVKTFTAFKSMYVKQKSIWINGRQIVTPTREFADGMQEEFERRVRPYTIRLRKADVLPDLPKKQYVKVAFELSPWVRGRYEKLRKEYFTELTADGDQKTLTAPMAISRITRLHQLVNDRFIADDGTVHSEDSGRKEALFTLLDGRPAGAKTIVWAHYRSNIEELGVVLADRYGAVSVLMGGMSDSERQDELNKFRKHGTILVANPATAGWGLTLTEADTAIYFTNSYNWEHRAQSEDRIHRIGQESSSVTYYDLVAANTIDEKILEVLTDKADFSQSVFRDFAEWIS